MTTLGDYSDSETMSKSSSPEQESKSHNNINELELTLKQEEIKFDLSRAKGFLYMVLSATMTTCMNLIIKYQSSNTQVNVIEAVIIRSLFLGMGSYLHLKKDKINLINIP